LNSYLLSASGVEDYGLVAMPLFLAIRAAIRAMVLVQTATATGKTVNPEAAQFLHNALISLHPPVPRLVLVGGMSGTGKTAVSRALAPLIGGSPGAVHLRSDLERKMTHPNGVSLDLPSDEYSTASRKAVYGRMFSRAGTILSAGHSVLLDATFLDADLRATAQNLAKEADAACHALWLEAPLPVLVNRVKSRRGDASDADEQVVREQSKNYGPPSDWQMVSAAGSLKETVELAQAALHLNPAVGF
jgi:predicted kinase